MLETVLIIPVVIALFVGTFNIADIVVDLQTGNIAAATAARLGAQLGNAGYSGAGTQTGCQSNGPSDPCAVDKQILSTIAPLIAQMPAETIVEVDIYQPTPCAVNTWSGTCPPDNGGFVTATDYGERYDSTNTLTGYGAGGGYAGAYGLDKRSQAHPNETSLGVQIRVQYTSPTLRYTVPLTVYAVARIAPSFS